MEGFNHIPFCSLSLFSCIFFSLLSSLVFSVLERSIITLYLNSLVETFLNTIKSSKVFDTFFLVKDIQSQPGLSEIVGKHLCPSSE